MAEKLRSEDIAAIYGRFAPGHSLGDDFQSRFKPRLGDEAFKSHQIVIVAASLDESAERIIGYLNQREVPINVICFQVFAHGSDQFISRSWLHDPAQTQVNATASPQDTKEPWNGEFYASFGHGDSRSWAEAVQYGFISAGGGLWYSNTLKLLKVIAGGLKAPGYGFVGVGRVVGHPHPFLSFQVTTAQGRLPATEVLKQGDYLREFINDPDLCEYFVAVQWLQTVPIEKAVDEIGLFGNQNTVCKPTTPQWRATVERLKQHFSHFADL